MFPNISSDQNRIFAKKKMMIQYLALLQFSFDDTIIFPSLYISDRIIICFKDMVLSVIIIVDHVFKVAMQLG